MTGTLERQFSKQGAPWPGPDSRPETPVPLLDTGFAPATLKLELTETTAMTDAARVIELLEEISARGVHIAVDDFGTVHSCRAGQPQLLSATTTML